jgi:cysteine sulfinate desulfinase/cysteine desulfurase-like protein
MGLIEKDSRSSIRFSLGRETDETQLTQKTQEIIALIRQLQIEEGIVN